jgi:hypothetical protein
MTWRSWLFPNSRAGRLEKKVHDIKRRVREQRQPINDLCLSIIWAADRCAKAVQSCSKIDPKAHGGRPELQQVYIFYEFIYFFLHITNRQAHRKLGPTLVATLQKEITPVIVPTAVDTFFAHWPETYKSGIEGTFYEKLNDAEMEYANCRGLISDASPIAESVLCGRLARNILSLSGYDTIAEKLSEDAMTLANSVQAIVLDSLNQKDFEELVSRTRSSITAS